MAKIGCFGAIMPLKFLGGNFDNLALDYFLFPTTFIKQPSFYDEVEFF